jgi:competence protein ComEA
VPPEEQQPGPLVSDKSRRLLEFGQLVASVVLTIAILGGIVTLFLNRPAPVTFTIIPAPPSATPLPTPTPGPLKVYVTGAVIDPGNVYTFNPGARVQDAVTAAGGFALDADIARVNLAAVLHDGDQVDVPSVRSSRPGAGPILPTQSGPIRINTATAADLERLPGVGTALAQRILDYRARNGPFKSFADLDKVPGIGQTRIAEWKDLISFDQ